LPLLTVQPVITGEKLGVDGVSKEKLLTVTLAACAALAVTRVARATPETMPSCFIFMKRKGLMVDDLSACDI
jgi:hypothetical protein